MNSVDLPVFGLPIRATVNRGTHEKALGRVAVADVGRAGQYRQRSRTMRAYNGAAYVERATRSSAIAATNFRCQTVTLTADLHACGFAAAYAQPVSS